MSQSVQQAALPVKAKIWPVVGQQAAHVRRGGAWRAWALAFALDPEGSGKVPADHLDALADSLGVAPRTWRRWRADAFDLGALRGRPQANHVWYASSAKVAALIAAEVAEQIESADCTADALHPFEWAGSRPVIMDAADLVATGWRAKVWAAFIETLEGRPISRERMQTLTNVPPRSQLRYERAEGVEAVPNFEVGTLTEDESGVRRLTFVKATDERIAYEREQGRACFAWWDSQENRKVMARRLPDRRNAPSRYEGTVAARGRTPKINRAIRDSLCIPAGQSHQPRRLFWPSVRAADRRALKLSKPKDKQSRVPSGWRELMGRRYGTRYRGAGVYAAIPLTPAGLL